MADGQALGDLFAGTFGHTVDRPALQSFVANSQAQNGLRSAQTQEALYQASAAQEEMAARQRLKDDLVQNGMPESQAQLHLDYFVGNGGKAKDAEDAARINQQITAANTLGDPNQLGTAAQTAAGQQFSGKPAPMVQSVPDNYMVTPGMAPPPVQQSPEGAAKTAAQGANAQLHTAQAENPAAFHPNAAGNAPALDKNTLDMMGDRFYETGALPPTGMGAAGAALRMQIMQSAAARATGARGPITDANGAGASATITGNAASNKAGGSVLTDMTKRTAMADSSEQTALKNLGVVRTYINKADQSGSPLINTIQNKLRAGLFGDPDVSAYHNAISTARDEYARVISMATGAQGITDAARNEGQRLFPDNISPAQFEANFQVAQQDMANRTGSMHEQIAGAKKNLYAGPQAPAPAVAAPATPAPSAGKPIPLEDYLKSKGY